MGAWGYGLFQSDYDYDIVADLSAECGLDKLQSDAEAKSNNKPNTLQNMRKMFTKCGLMPDALTQMDAALNGPGSYKGEPWYFDSPGLLETANSLSGGGGMNVPAPHGMFKGPDDSRLVAKIEARMAAYALEKDNHEICGAADCQATHSNAGRALLVCSKCKDRKYCSKDCQAKHWKSHKLVCIKAA